MLRHIIFFVWCVTVYTYFFVILSSDLCCEYSSRKELHFIVIGFCVYCGQTWRLLDKEEAFVAMLWLALISMLIVYIVGIKRKELIPVLKKTFVDLVIFWLKNRNFVWSLPFIRIRRKSGNLKLQKNAPLLTPSLVSVIGVSTDGDKSSEEASSTPVVAKAKKSAESLEEVSNVSNVKTKKIKSPASSVAKDKPKKRQSSPTKSTKGTTDCKLEALELKWSERFSRLEAMLLSKTLSQLEPSFQPDKVTPARPPPAGATKKAEPFFAPSQKNASDRPQTEVFYPHNSSRIRK